MCVINWLRVALVSIVLMSGAASGSIVEVVFSGDLSYNYVAEDVYGVSNGPYVPAGFEGETLFNGVLRYDDQAPVLGNIPSAGNFYGTAEVELTIGEDYSVTGVGTISAKNNYADSFDFMEVNISLLPVDFINPADEMIHQYDSIELQFYDDDSTVFDVDENLPTAESFNQFDRMLLRDLSIISEGLLTTIDCPECVEGTHTGIPVQSVNVQGTITDATVSAVPLPPSLLLFASGLGLLYHKAARKKIRP